MQACRHVRRREPCRRSCAAPRGSWSAPSSTISVFVRRAAVRASGAGGSGLAADRGRRRGVRPVAGAVALVRRHAPRDRTVVASLGVVLAAMNTVFYEAIARLPLATVGAIEFLGPIAIAAWGLRTRRNVAALVLAVSGVYALTEVRIAGDALGFLFAFANCGLFMLYIVSATGSRRTAGRIGSRPACRGDADRDVRRGTIGVRDAMPAFADASCSPPPSVSASPRPLSPILRPARDAPAAAGQFRFADLGASGERGDHRLPGASPGADAARHTRYSPGHRRRRAAPCG